jgi:subtilisin family serine protease
VKSYSTQVQWNHSSDDGAGQDLYGLENGVTIPADFPNPFLNIFGSNNFYEASANPIGSPSDVSIGSTSSPPTVGAASPMAELVGSSAMLDSTIGASGATAAQVQQAIGESGLAVTGASIKVGVLSDSFNNLGGAVADEGDGALPSSVTVLSDLSSGGTDEGRAMLQVVHDVAPGASLYFATAFGSETEFADNILALAAAGCKIICDDVSYYDEPFFQNGVVAQAIETVEQEGVIYLTAAGNNASNAYQNTWSPITSTSFDGEPLKDTENFGSSTKQSPVQTVTIGGSSSDEVPLLLEWNQPYGQATSDLAVLVFQNGQYLGRVTNANDGEPTNPWVGVLLQGGTTYQIAIENLSGPDPGLIKEIAAGDGIPIKISVPFSIAGSNVGTVFGHAMSPDAITVGAVSSAETPAFGASPPQSESFSSSGTGTELLFADNGTALASPESLSPVTLSGVDGINTTLSGGLDDFFGTSAATPSVAGVVALMLQADPNLTPAQVESMLTESATSFGNSSVSGAGLVNAHAAVTLATQAEVQAGSACYCRGTLILTDRGEIPVEALRIDDRLVTMSADTNPIKWIGRRSYSGRFVLGRRDILPICIKAGALGDQTPRRDLWISPHHAMFLDGVLIEAKDLINGVSVVQAQAVEKVEYFHLELDDHDVIFAEGALSESYVDDDNRGLFHNASEFQILYPDRVNTQARYCAPRCDEGYEIEAARRRIDARAGLRTTARLPALRGYVDAVGARSVAGWAQNIEHPDAPVCLDVYVAGELVGRVLANRYRADLARAGIGSGCHSFEFTLPCNLRKEAAVVVRRSLDGAELQSVSHPARVLRG